MLNKDNVDPDDVDPDAHTRLNFDPIDPEPTGRAEAWSGEQLIQDYPYSPESAPTVIVKEESSNSMMIVAAILVAAAMIFAGFVTVAMTGRDSVTTAASSTPTPTMVQSGPLPATPIRVPPPVTVTVTPPPRTSTVVAAPPPVPQPQPQSSSTCQLMRAQASQDNSVTAGEAMGYWVPQLSSKRPGLVADAISWDCDSIWAEHTRLRLAYNANLLWSGDFPNTYHNDNYWVSYAVYLFPTADGAKQWCVDHGRDVPEHCYPQQIR